MTGYGCGELSQEGLRISVEISSLNRKGCEISIALPRGMEILEGQLREQISKALSRGKIQVRIFVESEKQGDELSLNEDVAVSYVSQIRELAHKLGIEEDLTVTSLLSLPRVIQNKIELLDPERLCPLIQKALAIALNELTAMREREGKNIGIDLVRRIELLKQILEKIEKVSGDVPLKYRELLLKRIQKAGLEGISAEDPRVLQEVALYADHCDITEEVTRQKSHFLQFEQAVESPAPIGRMLDFLAQEMGREINTIGSKANDGVISGYVLAFKTELEKFREQVQNVE